MELTGIGTENINAFLPLMAGVDPADFRVAIGAIENGKAAGVALYNDLGDAIMLDYIFVLPEMRRKGIGTALVESFLDEIGDTCATALHVNYPEKSEELHGFFSSRGFRIFRDGHSWRVPIKALYDSEGLRRLMKTPAKSRVVKVNDLVGRERNILRALLEDEELDPGILSDGSLADELSFVAIDDATGAPEAVMLCEKNGETITVLYLANFSQETARLIDLFRKFAEAAEAGGHLGKDMIFVTMNDVMQKFVSKMVGSEELLINEGNVISAIRMIGEGD